MKHAVIECYSNIYAKRQRSLQVWNRATKKAAQNQPVYKIKYLLQENTYRQCNVYRSSDFWGLKIHMGLKNDFSADVEKHNEDLHNFYFTKYC